jgi:predicted RND superfamily exporter protein
MAMLSVVFVWIWTWRHTGSVYLASVGMGMILMSLPSSLLIYKVVYQIPYFVQIHILAVFLVLGIGADDVFVLVDAWKQSAKMSGDEHTSLSEGLTDEQKRQYSRLVFSLTRARQAIFNTSFTTAVAFLATGVSPVMPISSFGIYAATAIVMNYFMAITILPPAVIIYHRNFSSKRNYCYDVCCACCCFSRSRTLPESNDESEEGEAVSKKEDEAAGSSWFFEKVYIPAMTWQPGGGDGEKKSSMYPLPCLFIAVLVAVMISHVVYASKLQPPTEAEVWFRDEHMFTGFIDTMMNDFALGKASMYVKVSGLQV